MTLEAAVAQVNKEKAEGLLGRKGGRKSSTSTVYIQDEGTTKPQKDKKKSSPSKSPAKNGTVPGEDLLNHPDVPDKIKDQIRAAEGEAACQKHVADMSKGVQKYSKSTEIIIPVRFDLDTDAIKEKIAEYTGILKVGCECDLSPIIEAAKKIESMAAIPLTLSLQVDPRDIERVKDRIKTELHDALQQKDVSPFEALWYIADCQKECLAELRKIREGQAK